MRARICPTCVCLCVLIVTICAEPALRAQAPPSPQQPPAATTQDASNDLSVTVGKSVLVDTAEPITRVTVGMGDVAEAQATSSK